MSSIQAIQYAGAIFIVAIAVLLLVIAWNIKE